MPTCEICGKGAEEPTARIIVEKEGNTLTLEPVCQGCIDAVLVSVPPWAGTGSLIPQQNHAAQQQFDALASIS